MVDLSIRRREPERMGHGDWEYQYEVWLGEELIVAKSRDPEFDACRALHAAGHTGKARFWREWRAEHDISMDIATAIKWRTKETRKIGPHFVKFEEFPAGPLERKVLADA